jgi:hypothetical protein
MYVRMRFAGITLMSRYNSPISKSLILILMTTTDMYVNDAHSYERCIYTYSNTPQYNQYTNVIRHQTYTLMMRTIMTMHIHIQ